MKRLRRTGLSAVEVLVVVAILGLLVGLLLPAVQKGRQSALRIQNANRLRQLTLGMHSIVASHDGRVPIIADAMLPDPAGVLQFDTSYVNGGTPLLTALAIECDPSYAGRIHEPLSPEAHLYRGRIYQSSADPSFNWVSPDASTHEHVNITTGITLTVPRVGDCSMLVNALAANRRATISAVFADGTSNTIYLAEAYNRTQVTHYFVKENSRYEKPTELTFPGFPPGLIFYGSHRHATFADQRQGDVYPVAEGSPPVARGKLPTQYLYDPNPTSNFRMNGGVTPETIFQCSVPPHEARGKVPYSPYPTGLQCSMADGSVRFVRQSVSESAFWASVTPAGGEVASLD